MLPITCPSTTLCFIKSWEIHLRQEQRPVEAPVYLQGWSSDTKDVSSASIDSETFPCTIGSSNDALHFSLYDMDGEDTKSPGSVALQVQPKDKNGALGSSSSFANRGWKIVGSLDKGGSKAILTDSSGQILAVVLKRTKKTYLLLSKQPAFRGQKMHLRVERGTILYPWATTEEQSPLRFSIKRYDNLGITYIVDLSMQIFGTRTVHITDAATGQRYALIRQQQVAHGHHHAAASALFSVAEQSSWNVVSGPFVSPGLIMCVIAIINKDKIKNVSCDLESERSPARYIGKGGSTLERREWRKWPQFLRRQ
jgi:hypothetical protein